MQTLIPKLQTLKPGVRVHNLQLSGGKKRLPPSLPLKWHMAHPPFEVRPLKADLALFTKPFSFLRYYSLA